MADTSVATVRLVEEVTPGTTPASALTELYNVTSITGTPEVGTLRSAKLKSNFQPGKSRINTMSAGWGMGVEFVYGGLDIPLEGLFRSDWSTIANVVGTTISFDAASREIRDSGNGLSTSAKGRWVRISGSTANDGDYFIETATVGVYTVRAGLGAAPLVNGSAGPSITIKHGRHLAQGTTRKTYTVELDYGVQIPAMAEPFAHTKGQFPTALTLAIGQGIVTGNLTMMGSQFEDMAAATVGTGAHVAAVDREPLVGTIDVSEVWEGLSAAVSPAEISEMNLTLNAPGAVRHKLRGGTGIAGRRWNTFDFTGGINVYVDDAGVDLWQKFKAGTRTAIYKKLVDTDGNTRYITIPNILFNSGPHSIGGKDQDAYFNLGMLIDPDSTLGYMVGISDFDA